jgi:hypothetical protein
MAITFEQFFSAIVEQESGGNYGAIGPRTSYGRAYGKYQVLDSNIPSWTKAYYGKSLTPQQFLNNPKAQDAVARGKLQSYFNKYGPRGAAAAWYGGPGSAHLDQSTRSQQGGPSIKGYVDNVMQNAAKYPAGGGTSNFSTGSTVTPTLSSAELAEQYGFVSGLLNSNPELRDLFKQAVSGTWSADKFQAKLRNTKWWKTHSKDEREYLILTKSDPATAKQQMNQARVKAAQLAKQVGLTGKQLSGANMASYAYLIVAKGYDDAQIRNLMGQKLVLTSSTHTGQAGEAWDELAGYAYSMGVKVADSWMSSRVKNIVSGVGTQQDVKNELMKLAKAQFPQWTAQIDGGQTVQDIAAPYMQSMSQILELPSGSVNLFDPTIKKALNYTNPGSLQKEAKPLWQFENELRADPRWTKTKNAQDNLFQVGHQVLADFGFKY